MSAFRNFKIGEVRVLILPVVSATVFSIQDQNGAPLLSITYLTAAKTEWAHETIEIVLADAVEIVIPD